MAAETGPSTRKPARTIARPFSPNAKKRMFWRITRTARRASEHEGPGERFERLAHQDHRAGLGRDVGPGDGGRDPHVGQGEGGGVVDAVAHHRHDAPFLPAPLDPLGLVGGGQLGLHVLDVDLLRHRARWGGAIAGQDGQVFEAEMFQLVDDVERLGPHAVARADHTGDPPIDGHEQGRLARGVERVEGLLGLGRHGHPTLSEEAQVADQDLAFPSVVTEPGRDPGPGLRLEISHVGERQAERAGLSDEQARQRVLARALSGGGEPQKVVLAPALQRDAAAQFGAALGQGPGLVEGEGVNLVRQGTRVAAPL